MIGRCRVVFVCVVLFFRVLWVVSVSVLSVFVCCLCCRWRFCVIVFCFCGLPCVGVGWCVLSPYSGTSNDNGEYDMGTYFESVKKEKNFKSSK